MIHYLDAFRPEKGNRTLQGSFMEDWPLEDGKIILTNEIMDNIGKDVRGKDREWMLSKVTPWPLKYATDPVDEIIAGKWGALNGPYKVIESGHYPMITKPEELVEDMLALTEK
jgi:hypothetical protein